MGLLDGKVATVRAVDTFGQLDIVATGGFQPVGQVHRHTGWTPKELIDAKAQPCKGVSSGVPNCSICRQPTGGGSPSQYGAE